MTKVYTGATMSLDGYIAGPAEPGFDMTGALVVGRKLFDITSGWGGNHPLGCRSSTS